MFLVSLSLLSTLIEKKTICGTGIDINDMIKLTY